MKEQRKFNHKHLDKYTGIILLRLCYATAPKNLELLHWYERWNINPYHCVSFVNIETVLILSVCAFRLLRSVCIAVVGFILLAILTWKLQCCKSSHLPSATWTSGRSRTCCPYPLVFLFSSYIIFSLIVAVENKRSWFTVMCRALSRKLQGNSQ